VLRKEEKQLFVDLILKTTAGFDADAMALLWRDYVDGVTIFPKLPVYLREYHGLYLKNGRVKDAVKAMKSDVELLDALNKELVPPDLANEESEVCVMEGIETEGDIAVATGGVREHLLVASTFAGGWPTVPLPSVMPRPEMVARRSAAMGPPTVGGTVIGFMVEAPDALERRIGERGKDLKPRAKRKCRRCKTKGGQYATTCNGGKAGGVAACEYYRARPGRLWLATRCEK
jgi:hypothetical protein